MMGGDTAWDVMGALPVGVVLWRVEGDLCYANARASVIIGRPISLAVKPAEAVRAWGMLRAGTSEPYPPELLLPGCVEHGEVATFRDAEIVSDEGVHRFIEGWTVPVRDSAGTVAYAATMFLDVTETRRAAELRAGEARVLEMVAASRPLIETLAVLARVFEVQAEGMLASILLVQDGRVRHAAAPSLPDAWTKAIDGEPIGANRGSCGTAAYLKVPIVVSDIATDPRWALYRDAALAFGFRACWSTPILGPANEVLGTFAFYYSEPREPTERLLNLAAQASRLATVAIQHSLHEANLHRELSERLQMATRSARVGIWCWHVREDRLEWDEQMHRLYGSTPEQFAGDYEAWRTRVHPEDLARAEAALEAAVRGEADFDTVFRVLWPDGTLRHVQVNAVVQRTDSGDAVRVIGTNWDITESKLVEEALRRAKEEAEAATRAKSLFLANMSHEIRTPMNAILGYAQLLRKDQALSTEQRRNVEVIHSSGDHLLTLINDILEMSKIEAGRSALTLKAFDLHALLADLESMFAALSAEKGIELRFDLDVRLARVIEGDAVKVRQVVINLLSNALKFTERGYIQVRATSSPVGSDRAKVVIAVKDSGSGIQQSDLNRVFNPFDRLDSGVHTSGTGLGLAISSNFARLMDGDLRVDSVFGKGSTFTFSFEARVIELEASKSSPSTRLGNGSIGSSSRATPSDHLSVTPERMIRFAAELPADLIDELRSAALEARAGRITSLAERARAYSEAAAGEIQSLADSFKYDVLLAALDRGGTR